MHFYSSRNTFFIFTIFINLIGCQSPLLDSERTCHEDFVLNGLITVATIEAAGKRDEYTQSDPADCPDISLLSGEELYLISESIITTKSYGAKRHGNFENAYDLANFRHHYQIKSARKGYVPALADIEITLKKGSENWAMSSSDQNFALSCLDEIHDGEGNLWSRLESPRYIDQKLANKCLPPDFEESFRFLPPS